MTVPTHYIETADALVSAIADCSKASVLAIDTEFARFNTYYPMVGLIQIFDGHNCYLIDPLPLPSLLPLVDLMINPDIVKVFHSGSEDMEVFQHCLGTVPVNLFDSQVAAAALGVGFSMSYQAIVEHFLKIKIAKDETRSDWLQRPLTEGQLAYAALDVIHLLEVYGLLVADLDSQQRRIWAEEESAKLGEDLPIMVDPQNAYLKAKGLNGMTRTQLAVLRSIYGWREQVARSQNVPRNRVIDQKVIDAIVRSDVTDHQGLQGVAELTPRQLRKYGDDVISAITTARQLDTNEMPAELKTDRKPIDNKKIKRLRAVVETQARQFSVSPELLCKRRDLEQLVRSGEGGGAFTLPASLLGWREPIVGAKLLEAVAS